MAEYGLTANGFVPKTLEVLRDEMNEDLRGKFGASIDLSDNDPLGHLVGIMAERYAELWELAEAVNSSQDPDKAVDTGLDALAALTGTIRKEATHSTVVLTLTGTPSTAVPTGSLASTESTEQQFETLADGTIAAVAAWQASTAYAVGDRVTNNADGTDRVYQCTTAGTSAASGGPSGTGDAITDGGVTWRYLGDGTGAVDVDAQSVDTGPIVAVSGDITVIESPVSGWQGVINVLDATTGSNVETDEDLRVRREQELARGGKSPVDAIRVELLDVEGVTAVRVFHNPTNTTDADGLPPHSVEALVQGGEDQDIREALFAAVAAGIGTHGTVSGTVTDSQGIDHTVKFSRPTAINIWVALSVTKDPDTFPADGETQIKQAIVDYGDAQPTGKDVVANAIIAQVFKVTGVLDVTSIDIGTSDPPSGSATIPISLRELAAFDTSRIVVDLSDGTP